MGHDCCTPTPGITQEPFHEFLPLMSVAGACLPSCLQIPLVPVFDPEKTSIPPASFVASLAPDLQPLFKVGGWAAVQGHILQQFSTFPSWHSLGCGASIAGVSRCYSYGCMCLCSGQVKAEIRLEVVAMYTAYAMTHLMALILGYLTSY
jgi:hypothetical protein